MSFLRNVWKRLPENVRRAIGMRRLRQSAATSRALARHNSRLPASAPTLSFYPERPLPRTQMIEMLALLGVRVRHGLSEGPQIAWQRGTRLSPADVDRLPAHTINRGCTDVSKSRVDALWAQVAGYSVTVDPVTTEGPIVVKSEENARHDWRLVQGPLKARQPGMVYQRLIDATAGDVFVQSRPVIMRGQIPLIYDVRFPRQHWRAEAETFPARVGDFYSPPEVDLILAFSAAIGLEYGELDVLRENSSGRLFVIDANPTPVRPHHIAAADEKMMLSQMSEALAGAFGPDLAR